MECGQSKGTFELICQLALSLHLQDPVVVLYIRIRDAFNEPQPSIHESSL